MTQTGVHVPILNVFAAFVDDADASNPTRMFKTSTLGGAPHTEGAQIDPRTARAHRRPASSPSRHFFVVISTSLIMEYADLVDPKTVI